MIKKNKYIWVLGLTIAITSCDVNNELAAVIDEEVATVALTAGNADFSKYIAVGASFTSGYTDGALFIAAQENSFPNTLASKFAMVGGGEFNQPLMNDNVGGLLIGGQPVLDPDTGANTLAPRFYFDGSGPSRLDAASTTETTTKVTGSLNNFGVPGAKSYHIVAPGFGSVAGLAIGAANPYFVRFSSSETTTVLADAVAQSPTFFTLSEMGGNDVLLYAVGGGAGEDQTGNIDAATYGGNDITDPNVFASAFNGMVTALTANGAKGVVSNVPDITSLAHFTTVPYNPVPLDEATAVQLNAGYATYNGGLQSAAAALAGTGLFTDEELVKRTISFTAGSNAVVIVDEDLTDLGAINPAFSALPKYRQATAEDLLVLSSSAIIGEVNKDYLAILMSQGLSLAQAGPLAVEGLTYPLTDKWVLTPEEQEVIKTATDAYNTTIASVASSNANVVMVDLNSVLTEAATTGLVFDDYTLTTNLVTGGLISLDGIHLTARGYALMANKMLEVIDTEFGSNFTEATDGLAKASNYPTNYSPLLQ